MTATNEEITSSVDRVSDLGIELKLDSLSHKWWGQDFFAKDPFMNTFLVFQIHCWQLKTSDIGCSSSLTLPNLKYNLIQYC